MLHLYTSSYMYTYLATKRRAVVVGMNWQDDLDGVHLSLANWNFNLGQLHINYIQYYCKVQSCMGRVLGRYMYMYTTRWSLSIELSPIVPTIIERWLH